MPIIEYNPLPDMLPIVNMSTAQGDSQLNPAPLPAPSAPNPKGVDVTSLKELLSTIGIVVRPDAIQSFNFTAGVTGWELKNNGTITGKSGFLGGWTMDATSLYSTGVKMTSGANASVAFGTVPPTSPILGTGLFIDQTGLFGLSANTQNFKISATDGSITSILGVLGSWNITSTNLRSGATNAASNILLDPINSIIRLGPTSGNYWTFDGVNLRMRSSNYVSGFAGSGITIEPNLLEVGNIACRGLFRTYVLQKDIISAQAGSLIIAPNADVLDADVATGDTVITTKGTTTMVKGDIIRIKDGTNDEWMLIHNPFASPTYGVVRNIGNAVNVATLDSTTADTGTWTGNQMNNFATDTTNSIEGTGCFSFDVNGAVGYSYIENTTYTSQNWTGRKDNGYFIARVYVSDSTAMSGITLYWGTDNGNRWHVTGTLMDGTPFTVGCPGGWNYIKFSFSAGYTTEGSPNIADIRHLAMTLSQTAPTVVGGYKFDAIQWVPTSTPPSWKKGASIVDYGINKKGGLYLTASDTNAPYMSVYTHTGTPWSGLTTQLRVGNLNGYLGYAADTYGFGVGSSSGTNANITIDPTNGIRIRKGTTNMITFDQSGNASFVGSIAVGTGGNIHSGQSAYNTGTGWWLEYNSGTPRFSLGDGTVANSLTWDGSTLSVNGSALNNQAIFGDGSDGDATISADTTLSSDMFYNNLTVNAGFTLNPGGYRIFVKGTLTINSTGIISRNGASGGNGGNGADGAGGGAAGGTAGSAPAALADGSLPGAPAGKAGLAGKTGQDLEGVGAVAAGIAGAAGTAGTNAVKAIIGNGVAGGTGGNGGFGTTGSGTGAAASGGTLGAAGTSSGTILNKIRTYTAAYLLYDEQDGTWFDSSAGSGSGGGGASAGISCTVGGGNYARAGGGGGSGASGTAGGIVEIFARTIVNNGTISANGGNGGNGGNAGLSFANINAAAGGSGGGAGGGGGDGGILILVYSKYSGSGTTTVTAGSSGTGGTKAVGVQAGGNNATDGTNGAAGTAGTTGISITLQQ